MSTDCPFLACRHDLSDCVVIICPIVSMRALSDVNVCAFVFGASKPALTSTRHEFLLAPSPIHLVLFQCMLQRLTVMCIVLLCFTREPFAIVGTSSLAPSHKHQRVGSRLCSLATLSKGQSSTTKQNISKPTQQFSRTKNTVFLARVSAESCAC